MKTKYLILSMILLLGAGMVSTSCEDMFTPDNSLVETDMTPKDTVFQILGIVRGMEKVVDKSIVLGEVRADLVDVTPEKNPYAPTEIQQISNNQISEENPYNSPSDFYSVINSCNTYLAYVDSLQETKGVRKYREEVIAAKTFRAWAYLELAKIYGEVPFFTKPLLTAAAGDEVLADASAKKNLVEICNVMIDDMNEGIGIYKGLNENNALLPDYSTDYQGIRYRKFFIPVRLMLAELYLYRGSFTQNQADFREAAILYHDYLTFTNEEINMYNSRSTWNKSGDALQSNYDNNFNLTSNSRDITIIPMDTIGYNGVTTDIRPVFNGQYSNNYYPYVSASDGLLELSQSQLYFNYISNSSTDYYTQVMPRNKAEYTVSRHNPEWDMGDLRFRSVVGVSEKKEDRHPEYNPLYPEIKKYTNGNNRVNGDERPYYLRLYRVTTVYLHFAEALNRAGFPETAFAVLKYGLSDDVMNDRTIISQAEYDEMAAINSYGFASNLAYWNRDKFRSVNRSNYSSTGADATAPNQIGIHALGSGDVWADTWCEEYKYEIPMPSDMSGWQEYPEYVIDEAWTEEELAAYDEQYKADCATIDAANEAYLRSPSILMERQQAVDKMILDEEALENCFEGTRFYDLMRYSMYWNGDFSYLVEAVSHRKGSETTIPVGTLTPSNVYLPLRSR